MRAILERWLTAQQQDAPCTERCFLLSRLSISGKVGAPLAFALHGRVLAKGEQRIPLFGDPSSVRLDDVTLDGSPAKLGFDSDGYFVLVDARSFVLRGRLTLSDDLALTVEGPVNAFDADLGAGRVVEGERLSGLSKQTLHFDPMTPESRKKTPAVFRLSRALRVGKEIAFTYRLTASPGDELGAVRLPLAYGEQVREVSGAVDWSVAGGELLLPIAGTEANVTITGTLPKVGAFSTDGRSAYEWWLVESDPDHKVALDGEGKLVENGQSPIPPTMPNARTVLLQRGEHFEISATSFVQGDVLAAVARKETRFVVMTGRGEVVGEELIDYENNGLDLMTIDPDGRPIFVATDGSAERVLYAENDRSHVHVPALRGRHQLVLQTLAERKIGWFGGLLSVPAPSHALTASAVDVTVGLPAEVVPLAFLGGDRVRWAVTRGDLVAVALGAVAAFFAFRTRRTRALGAVVVGGLWFVSHDVFLVASVVLTLVGLIFVASRFLRGTALLAVSGLALAAGVLVANALVGGVRAPTHDLVVDSYDGEAPRPAWAKDIARAREPSGLDGKSSATPVSLVPPRVDTYVTTSRQLVSKERPFAPRIVYATHGALVALEVAWACVLALLVWAHKEKLAAAWSIARARLSRRPEPPPAREPAF